MPPAASSGSSQQPEKKKRRQNVACDSCRLRRVKCDMLALLTPADSTRVMPPLHVLVRENPDVSCSNCISKGIRCTTNQIVNPSKPNKGGKRIEEAKKMYGSEGAYAFQFGESGAPTPYAPTPQPGSASLHPSPPPQFNRQTSNATTASSRSSTSFDASDPNAVPMSVDLNNGNAYLQFGPGSNYPYPSGDIWSADTANAGIGGNTSTGSEVPTWTTEWGCNAVSSASCFGPFDPALFEIPPGASEPPIWDTLVVPPTPSDPHNQVPASSYASSPYAPSTSAQQYRGVQIPPLPLEMAPKLGSQPEKFPSIALSGSYDSGQDQYGLNDFTAGDPFPVEAAHLLADVGKNPFPAGSARREASPTGQIVGKKRAHDDEDVIEIVRSEDESEEEDPWGLWAPPNKKDSLVRWSRSEEVGDSMANRVLGSELSRHLVRIYFSSVHLTLPSISPEAFYMAWQQAGERSDLMSPAQEVLCAVIEAWASRFSDHRVVLGLDRNKPHNSPKLILGRNGTYEPHSHDKDQTSWGRQRLPVCVALVERARKLIDHHGILRKPSVTGTQAIALFTQLQHMTDSSMETPEMLMETEMLHAILIEQLHRLDVAWMTGESVGNKRDAITDNGQLRIKQRRLYWTVMISDAFWAAASCAPPKVPEEDMEASGAWLNAVEHQLAPSSYMALSFFLRCLHKIAYIGRRVARKLAVPSKRPGRVDVVDFCNHVRAIWKDISELNTHVNDGASEAMSYCSEEILGFSPVHMFANLRLSTTFLLLMMQEIVREMFEFRKRLFASFGDAKNQMPQAQAEATRVSALEELHVQSIDTLLASARAQAPLFESLLSTGIFQSGAMTLRVLLATAQFLSEIPTNEQGYPSTTLGGVQWTWENKQAEVGRCVDALKQMGWAWSDVSDILKHIDEAMARLTPSPEVLAAYAKQKHSKPESTHLDAQRTRYLQRDRRACEAVLRFWPPASVPDIVGGWTEYQRLISPQQSLIETRGLFEAPLHHRTASIEGGTASQGRSAGPSTSSGPKTNTPRPVFSPSTETDLPYMRGSGSAVIQPRPFVPDPQFVDTANLSQAYPPQALSPLTAGLTAVADSGLGAELESFLESLTSGVQDGLPGGTGAL